MTAKACEAPETDETKEPRDVQLEVVRNVIGRPLFLTARRFIGICKLIETGESASEACRQMLVTYTAFRKHVQRKPSYQRRLKEAEETREEFLREYHIQNIKKHAPRNVLRSLWWLERRYPREFALRNVNRGEGSTDQQVFDRVSESELADNARIAQAAALNPPVGLISNGSSTLPGSESAA
jgi:hypothetical protein